MKKLLSILFLLLANSVILTHAFVPHHHHDGIVVILHSTETSQHDNNDATEECSINSVYTLSENSPKIVSLINWNCEYAQFILPGILVKLGLEDEVGLSFRQKPYIQSKYQISFSNSIGLRAPPVC